MLELRKWSRLYREGSKLGMEFISGPTLHVPRLPDHPRLGRQASALRCSVQFTERHRYASIGSICEQ